MFKQCLKFVVEIPAVTRLYLDFNMFYCDNRYSQLIVVKTCDYFTKHVHMSKHGENAKSNTGGVKILIFEIILFIMNQAVIVL